MAVLSVKGQNHQTTACKMCMWYVVSITCVKDIEANVKTVSVKRREFFGHHQYIHHSLLCNQAKKCFGYVCLSSIVLFWCGKY